VDKLLTVGFIREIMYLDWLANMVIMKKKHWKVENIYRFHQFEQGMSK
jgi:hypothetical protein